MSDGLRSVEAVDVVVAGGGPAGLAATLAFAAAGLRSVCVERRAADAGADLSDDVRTAALLAPSIALLERIGVWSRAAGAATPLKVMRLIEAGGRAGRARKSAPFRAEDVGKQAFGFNIANAALKRALLDAVAAEPMASLRAERTIADIHRRDDAAHVALDTGERLRAPLLVAADGRDSHLRAEAGIGARRIRYGQSALVCVVAHDTPHANVSTEIHRDGGPFTLVPHTDGPDGRQRSGIVWMMRDADADRRVEMPPDAFAAEATERSLSALGPLTLVSERMRWPIVSQIADRFAAKRLALIAEAAHVVPPIGAQGLNMSLVDVTALVDIVTRERAAGRDIGAPRALSAYARPRQRDAAARVLGTAALNVAAIGALRPVRDLRLAALSALYDAPALRRLAMRAGLGG